jgi:hypothetical protein
MSEWKRIEYVKGDVADECRAVLAALGFDPATATPAEIEHAARLVDGLHLFRADPPPEDPSDTEAMDQWCARQEDAWLARHGLTRPQPGAE